MLNQIFENIPGYFMLLLLFTLTGQRENFIIIFVIDIVKSAKSTTCITVSNIQTGINC